MADIKTIYGGFVEGIQDAGDDHCRSTCPCPQQKRRVFHFSTTTGYFGCWSCGDHGSLYRFLTTKGVPKDVVRDTCRDVVDHAPTKEVMLRKKQVRSAGALTTLPDYILAAYHSCPVALVEAGFDELLLERYDVGFDTVAQRITFAIRDKEGQLVGVSGRAALPGILPKYQVYDAEPAVPNQRRAGPFFEAFPGYRARNRDHVYGLHTFWHERAHKKGEYPPIIITEGYKSTLWLRQQGFEYAVGIMGSDLTHDQEKLLAKVGGPYVVLLDYENGKQIPDPKKMAERTNLLRQRRTEQADKIRPCSAVHLATRLQRYGPATVGQYPAGKALGTAPDDLNQQEIEASIRAAVSPTIAVLNARPGRSSPSAT